MMTVTCQVLRILSETHAFLMRLTLTLSHRMAEISRIFLFVNFTILNAASVVLFRFTAMTEWEMGVFWSFSVLACFLGKTSIKIKFSRVPPLTPLGELTALSHAHYTMPRTSPPLSARSFTFCGVSCIFICVPCLWSEPYYPK